MEKKPRKPKAAPIEAKGAASSPALPKPKKEKPAAKETPKRTRKTVLARKTPGAKPPAQPAPSPSVLAEPKPPEPHTPKKRARKPRPLKTPIPKILLEGDQPAAAPMPQGSGKRFVGAAAPPAPVTAPERREIPAPTPAGAPPELPASYGTQQIFVAARDPYCLFLSWDLDAEQARRYAKASPTGTLVARLRKGFAEGDIALEVHVEPEHRDRFVTIPTGARTFVAELGYYDRKDNRWRRVSVSKPATAPPDVTVVESPALQTPLPEMFAIFPEAVRAAAPTHQTLPPEPPPEPKKEEPVWVSHSPTPLWAEEQPPAPAPMPIQEFAVRAEPVIASAAPADSGPQGTAVPTFYATSSQRLAPEMEIVWDVEEWTPAQEEALAELITRELRYFQEGSIELAELMARHLGQAPTSPTPKESVRRRAARALGLAGPEEKALSSEAAIPPAPEAGKKPFWFRVNAELVIYGATEPDARVTIGGRAIKLRPDGTFSYRFSLPDGEYELPILALSKDREHSRAAELRFSRASIYSGDVRAERQDPALRKPAAENVS